MRRWPDNLLTMMAHPFFSTNTLSFLQYVTLYVINIRREFTWLKSPGKGEGIKCPRPRTRTDMNAPAQFTTYCIRKTFQISYESFSIELLIK